MGLDRPRVEVTSPPAIILASSPRPCCTARSSSALSRSWWTDVNRCTVTCQASTSGGFPISGPPLRLGELVATLALAQDNAFGQPLESQLRSCLLARGAVRGGRLRRGRARDRLLGRAAALRRVHGPRARGVRRLRRRHRPPRPDARASTPRIRPRSGATMVAFATAGRPPRSTSRSPDRSRRARTTGRCTTSRPAARWATCSSSGSIFGPDVRDAFALHLRALERERLPDGTRRASRSRCAMRVVHLSHDMEAIGRRLSPAKAIDAARERRDRTYDPELADLFVAHGMHLVRAARQDRSVGRRARPRTGATPHPGRARARRRAHGGGGLHRPEVPVHGRPQPRCAQLAADAAGLLGCTERRDRHAPPGRAAPRVRHDRHPELDPGQARPAHTRGVRSRRASTRCSPSRCSAARRRSRR